MKIMKNPPSFLSTQSFSFHSLDTAGTNLTKKQNYTQNIKTNKLANLFKKYFTIHQKGDKLFVKPNMIEKIIFQTK